MVTSCNVARIWHFTKGRPLLRQIRARVRNAAPVLRGEAACGGLALIATSPNWILLFLEA